MVIVIVYSHFGHPLDVAACAMRIIITFAKCHILVGRRSLLVSVPKDSPSVRSECVSSVDVEMDGVDDIC